MLTVAGLTTVFDLASGSAPAVDDVSFEIREGETLGLVGESGSGKSVTALSILRLVRPPGRIAAGRVVYKGRDLLALSEKDMERVRGAEIALILQEPMTALNPVYTIGQHIAEALLTHRRATRRNARSQAISLLQAVRIPEADVRVDDYPHQLSGGMRQRVLVAMAIACTPSLVIADEPTTALDVTIQAEILDLLRDMKRTLNLSLLLVTHDMGVIAETADRVAVMYAGRIVEHGPVRAIFRAPQHPYTRGLLASMPGGARGGRLHAIDGAAPRLSALPTGCAFHPRCTDRFGPCAIEPPPEYAVGADHGARCHLSDTRASTSVPLAGPASASPSPTVGGHQPLTRSAPEPRQPQRIPFLQVSHLVKTFPRHGGLLRHGTSVTAVDHVSFGVERGETFGLVGESGSGKTTTGRCILRLVEPTAGSVMFQGEDVLGLSSGRMRERRRDMQIVFQDPYSSLNPRMRAGQIVEEALIIHGLGDRASRRVRVAELLHLVGLEPAHLDRFPHELSGGQRQRIGLARALSLNPSFLILDEPVSALDVSVQAQVVNLLLDLQQRLELTYLFIAHDLRLVEHICHRVAVMYAGAIVEMGPTDTIFEAPQHPYTRALLSAIPASRPDAPRQRIAMDGGAVDRRATLREIRAGHWAAI